MGRASLLLLFSALVSFSLQDVSPPTQQNPVVAPPVPVISLSSDYIGNSSAAPGARDRRSLVRRGGPEICGPGKPCADKSCCGTSGICGYGAAYCGPGNCTSNCDAAAMCGRDSDGGNVSCGMNLCCSYYGWCGTTENHCGNPDPNGLTPCQKGYGLCQIVPSPSCSAGDNTASGRTIGYYQASNVRDRACNKISPSQIVTNGFTHLYFAFAKFDPKSWQIVPGNDGDVALYTQFTALQAKGLKTWIAIGGFDFSDPGTTTFTAWSNMTSTQANRAAFISSLESFMSQHDFQGVDLDWEYPATPERGGQRADIGNFVSLVKEMRVAWGSRFGISVTLAPDYWYLRGFDAKAMEASVDWFGFMTYDLHGFWDASIATLGASVRAQTDIRDIAADVLPLWFDHLDPNKINFGLAYYGRGYTLADPSCNTLGCAFSGPSKPAPCSNFAGVMSLREIEQKIAALNLKPSLLTDSMIKQLVWADQWIGYDDSDTIALKRRWANEKCFGGTMVWSVDFNSGSGSGDLPPNTTDGTCGTAHGGTVCGNWRNGNCCSASGFCGDTLAHCGSGCQSGDCITGGITTDGSCGAQHANSYCGDWTSGSCCSSSGFCGNGTAFCGTGCQSGLCDGIPTLGSGPIHISPEVYNKPDPVVACYPPCTFIFPPWSLSTATTISVKPITLTARQSGLLPPTITTTITIPPVTTSGIDVWNYQWTDTRTKVIYFTSSVVFPAVTLSAQPSPSTTSTSSSGAPVVFWTYTPYPYPPYDGPKITPLPPGGIVIPPYVSPTPPPGPPPGNNPRSVSATVGSPGPICRTGQICGHYCLTRCLPKPPCRGTCNCIGPQCPPIFGDDDDESSSCTSTKTVSTCTHFTSTAFIKPANTITTFTWDSCETRAGCDLTDSTTTSTITTKIGLPVLLPPQIDIFDHLAHQKYLGSPDFAQTAAIGLSGPVGGRRKVDGGGPMTGALITSAPGSSPTSFISCTHQNADPGLGRNSGNCICSGSTFSEFENTKVTPFNYCAYTTMPDSQLPTATTRMVTDIDTCKICPALNAQGFPCQTLAGCTPKPTSGPAPPGLGSQCIVAHTFMSQSWNVADANGMDLQVWIQGKQVCKMGWKAFGASAQSVFKGACPNSAYEVYVTSNGHSVKIRPIGDADWEQLPLLKNADQRKYECGGLDSRPLYCRDYEATLAKKDECARSNCGLPTPCERTECPKFDAGCK